MTVAIRWVSFVAVVAPVLLIGCGTDRTALAPADLPAITADKTAKSNSLMLRASNGALMLESVTSSAPLVIAPRPKNKVRT